MGNGLIVVIGCSCRCTKIIMFCVPPDIFSLFQLGFVSLLCIRAHRFSLPYNVIADRSLVGDDGREVRPRTVVAIVEELRSKLLARPRIFVTVVEELQSKPHHCHRGASKQTPSSSSKSFLFGPTSNRHCRRQRASKQSSSLSSKSFLYGPISNRHCRHQGASEQPSGPLQTAVTVVS